MKLPTLDELEAWVRSLPEGSEAGVAGDACDCPLARYLRSLGAHAASVSAIGISTYDAQGNRLSEDFPTTALAAFVFAVDRRAGERGVLSISREQALGIVASLKRQPGVAA